MRITIFLSCLISLFLTISNANDLSPTFLPMIKGEWKIISDHSGNGRKEYQACLTDEQLQSVYGYDDLWQIFKENRAGCELKKKSIRNRAEYDLSCEEPGMKMTIEYRLTKKAYNQYVLEKSLVTVPVMPAIEFQETISFERLGKCQSESKK